MSRTRGGGGENLHDRSAVKTYLRIRPLSKAESADCPQPLIVDQSHTTAIINPGNTDKQAEFKFDQVFGAKTSQKELFDQTTRGLVEDLLVGKNGCVAMYGSSNAGKTFTMQGDDKEGGLVTRTVDILFNSVHKNRAPANTFAFNGSTNKVSLQQDPAQSVTSAQHKKTQSVHDKCKRRKSYDPTKLGVTKQAVYSIFVSYIEISGKKVYDLLEESETLQKGYTSSRSTNNRQSKKLLRDQDGGAYFVQHVIRKEVHSPEEAFAILRQGQQSRKVAATSLNATSSRSHSIFNVEVVQVALESHQPRPHSAYLSLVDMAGSERATKTGNDNVRRAEAKLINESLLVWRRCIRSLHQNQTSSRSSTKVKVPYNESMLTKCVKNFFEGDGQMVVITCVSPASKGERENHETLKFSSYFSDITTASSTIPPPQPRRPRPRTTTTNNVKYQQLQTLEEETEEQPVMKSTRPALFTRQQHHLQQSQPVPSTPLTMDEFESRLVTAAQSLHSVELDYEQLKKESDSIQHVFEQKQTELLHVEQETQKLRKEQEDYFETQEEWRIRSDTSRALLVKEIDDYEILEEEREKLQVEVSEMYATNSNLKIQQRTKVTGLMESKQKLTQLQEEQDSAESEMRSTNIATAEDYERRRVELEELTEYEVEEIERAIEDEHIKTKKLSAIISAVRSILNNDQQAKNKQKLHMLEESMAELGVTFDDDDHDVSFEGLQQSLMQSGFGRSYVENESNVTSDASESMMSTSAINLDISTHETDKSLLLDIANNDDENFKENSRPCTHSSDNHAHKKKKAKILDQMSHSFKDPGGDFTYNRAKKQVSTPKVKDLFKGKKVMVDEVRVHTQQDCSEHTIVAGKVSKSITGNGASVTFYGLESKTLDPNMSILDRRKRRRDRTNK